MKGSWKLARISGIDVYVHWTFSILLLWILLAQLSRGGEVSEAIHGMVLMLAVFGCVVLHEFGHALAARRFDIKTEDITLLPIGGVARLERMPREPWQEFVVAIAGPAVNVVIAAILFVLLLTIRGLNPLPEDFISPSEIVGGPLLFNLLVINVMLVVFNMLPAFPMDGGRVLRALLATRLDYTRATMIAASVGKMMAIGLGIVGLFGNAMLVFVAAFVYLGAEGESRMVQMTEGLRGLLVRDAMMRRYRTLSPDHTLRTAADELLLGNQRDFPVVDGNRLMGIVRQSSIVSGIRDGGMDTPVTSVMEPVGAVSVESPLDEITHEMRQAGSGALPVLDRHQQLVGMLSMENVGELLMIRSALNDRGGQSVPKSDLEYV